MVSSTVHKNLKSQITTTQNKLNFEVTENMSYENQKLNFVRIKETEMWRRLQKWSADTQNKQ